jgi:SAM-dependent methyltransferase
MKTGMRNRLENVYLKELFAPSSLGVFINPFYISRKRLSSAILARRQFLTGRLLDFGCGSKPYRDMFEVDEYVGVDIDASGHSHTNEQIDVYYDGRTLPFEDDYFDSIFSSQVFEHISNLEEILGELYRVLRPGGHMLATFPFVWEEHEIPFDFKRYSSFGSRDLLLSAGFQVVGMAKSSTYVETMFQMWNAYVSQHLLPPGRLVRALATPLLVAPSTAVGLGLSRILPENRHLYLDNVVLARKAPESV